MRPSLTLFVLVNYLTVLLSVNLLLNKPALSAQNQYVHAATCQENHYLALDCFDKCNSDDSWKDSAKDSPEKEVTIILAVHLSSPVFSFETLPFFASAGQKFLPDSARIFTGFITLIFSPPKIG